MDVLPTIKLEIVVVDSLLDSAAAAVVKGAKIGKIGDGEFSSLTWTNPSALGPKERAKKPINSLTKL